MRWRGLFWSLDFRFGAPPLPAMSSDAAEAWFAGQDHGGNI